GERRPRRGEAFDAARRPARERRRRMERGAAAGRADQRRGRDLARAQGSRTAAAAPRRRRLGAVAPVRLDDNLVGFRKLTGKYTLDAGVVALNYRGGGRERGTHDDHREGRARGGGGEPDRELRGRRRRRKQRPAAHFHRER